MPNIRFGVRYTTDETKDLAYLQLQKDNEVEIGSFARPGELFINEPLQKIYYCDSTTNQFVELNPDPPELTTADKLSPQETVPVLSTSDGATGNLAWDATHLYICTDTNTWKRINFDSWV